MKKIILTALSAILAMTALSSCGSKTIRLATNAEFPPFEYVTEKGIVGKFSGIDIAISAEIAKELGKELTVEDMAFEGVLLALTSSKADFVAAGLTADDERRKTVDFSEPYFVATQYMIVKEGNTTIMKADDLKDKKVGVIDGFTGQQICMDTLKIPTSNLQGYKKAVDAVADLVNGKLDAVVIDSHTAIALIAQNKGLKFVEDPAVFEIEEYAIAVKKGNKQLLDKINKVLKTLEESGKIDEFVAKYTAEAGME